MSRSEPKDVRNCPGCRVEHAPGSTECPASRVGQLIAGRYRVIRMLATGGMGAVYKAKKPLGNWVALKLLLPKYVGHGPTHERFIAEARSTAVIDHPGVVRILDLVEKSEIGPIIEMEWLEGKNLSQLLSAGPFGVDEAVETIMGALDALSAIHATRTIHRDIKPENIFRDRRGQIKVLDLGIAKNARIRTTRPVGFFGTAYYASPEHCRNPTEVTFASDIYSTGVVLFELLTGRLPVEHEDEAAQVGAVIAGRVDRRPSALRPEIPRWLDEIVERALALEPSARYPSAAAMREALRRRGSRGWVRLHPHFMDQFGARVATDRAFVEWSGRRTLRGDPEDGLPEWEYSTIRRSVIGVDGAALTRDGCVDAWEYDRGRLLGVVRLDVLIACRRFETLRSCVERLQAELIESGAGFLVDFVTGVPLMTVRQRTIQALERSPSTEGALLLAVALDDETNGQSYFEMLWMCREVRRTYGVGELHSDYSFKNKVYSRVFRQRERVKEAIRESGDKEDWQTVADLKWNLLGDEAGAREALARCPSGFPWMAWFHDQAAARRIESRPTAPDSDLGYRALVEKLYWNDDEACRRLLRENQARAMAEAHGGQIEHLRRCVQDWSRLQGDQDPETRTCADLAAGLTEQTHAADHPAPEGETVEALLRGAKEAFQDRHVRRAMELFGRAEALARRTRSAPAWIRLAHAYSDILRDPDATAAALREAGPQVTRINDAIWLAFLWRAEDPSRALEWLEDAERRLQHEGHIEAVRQVAASWQGLFDDVARARRCLEEAEARAARAGDHAALLDCAGEWLSLFDAREESDRCVGRARSLARDSGAMSLCAEFAAKHGQAALAREWMSEAERMARNGSDLAICALSWYHIGEGDAALRCRKKAGETARTSAELAELAEILAWSSSFRPDSAQVESILSEAEKRAASLSDVLACLRAYERWGMEDKARSCLREAERRKLISPERCTPRTAAELSRSWQRFGEPGRAALYLAQCAPATVEELRMIANAWRQLGDLSRSQACLLEAEKRSAELWDFLRVAEDWDRERRVWRRQAQTPSDVDRFCGTRAIQCIESAERYAGEASQWSACARAWEQWLWLDPRYGDESDRCRRNM